MSSPLEIRQGRLDPRGLTGFLLDADYQLSLAARAPIRGCTGITTDKLKCADIAPSDRATSRRKFVRWSEVASDRATVVPYSGWVVGVREPPKRLLGPSAVCELVAGLTVRRQKKNRRLLPANSTEPRLPDLNLRSQELSRKFLLMFIY